MNSKPLCLSFDLNPDDGDYLMIERMRALRESSVSPDFDYHPLIWELADDGTLIKPRAIIEDSFHEYVSDLFERVRSQLLNLGYVFLDTSRPRFQVRYPDAMTNTDWHAHADPNVVFVRFTSEIPTDVSVGGLENNEKVMSDYVQSLPWIACVFDGQSFHRQSDVFERSSVRPRVSLFAEIKAAG